MSDASLAPGADRRQLQQIITGLTEGVILLEPDQRIAWANPTALCLHGVSDIDELGTTASEYRSRFELRHRNGHALSPDDYPTERLLQGEAFREVIVEVNRVGDERRWFHRIRTLVLTDPRGLPDCLVLIINDETERFNAEERFERAFAANPAPAIIARLSDMRYVKVNQGFLELTGYRSGELLGRSLHEVDVLRDAEKRDLAVSRLHAGETIPQMEACLRGAAGHDRVVLLSGQPIEIGDESCMLFTFADLHPRHQAQHALKHSEERFTKAFELAPGPMAIFALDGLRVLDVNSAFTATTGWRREEVIGRGEAELALWGDGHAREVIERRLRESGRLRGVEAQFRNKDGGVSECLLSADTVEIHGAPCVLSLMVDITERKRTEADLQAAVQAVMSDSAWLGQKIVEKLAGISQRARTAEPGPEIAALPARARGVLELLARGVPDDGIARELGISRNTVRNHVSAIYRKIGIRKRSAIVVWARERGMGAGPNPLSEIPNSGERSGG